MKINKALSQRLVVAENTVYRLSKASEASLIEVCVLNLRIIALIVDAYFKDSAAHRDSPQNSEDVQNHPGSSKGQNRATIGTKDESSTTSSHDSGASPVAQGASHTLTTPARNEKQTTEDDSLITSIHAEGVGSFHHLILSIFQLLNRSLLWKLLELWKTVERTNETEIPR